MIAALETLGAIAGFIIVAVGAACIAGWVICKAAGVGRD